MCLDCGYHQRQRAAGNRDGRDGLGKELVKELRKTTPSPKKHEKLQLAMAEGSEKIGRIKV